MIWSISLILKIAYFLIAGFFKTMRRCFSLFVICVAFYLSPVALAVDLSDFPLCDMQACNSVAIAGEWPQVSLTKAQQVTFHGFNVSIPQGAVEMRSKNSFRQFDFGEKRWVRLSVFELDDMDELFKASRYTMVDWANIVFTQTPSTKPPETKAEAYAWYSSLMTKVVFVAGNLVTQYKKMPLIVYLISNTHSETDTLMVVSSKMPNVLLKVEAFGFDQLAINQLVSGLAQAVK